ncbi:MAG TPA: type II toxin-antitoxin system prevent-host-death family antitoxin [Gaiellaceae bacterium]|nr:type II toxin-antitoxin system prevent-host-death family antitoxin [Gaiellaceae bacterium]
MAVVRVGVRDLRENLRSWLDRVKNGDEVIVTDRGKPIARLGAFEPRSKLEELIERGIVRPPLRPKRQRIDVSKLPEMTPGPTLSDIVIEQRRQARY